MKMMGSHSCKDVTEKTECWAVENGNQLTLLGHEAI
jgi:hypothetical protein